MGRLTRDPEMRQTASGASFTRFTIAVNRRFAKEGQQQADFISCVAWRQTGDFICRYFRKGSMIAVTGSIQTSSWDGNDGQKHYSTDVSVDEAFFTGSRNDSGNAGGAGTYRQPQGGAFQAQPQAELPQDTEPNLDDFDAMGFSALDGSEDDLPF